MYSADCYVHCSQIHDGRSAGAHMLGRYCNSIPNITSTHNKIYLWFRADHSIAHSGFALTWNSTDPGTIPVCPSFLSYKIRVLEYYTFRHSLCMCYTWNEPFLICVSVEFAYIFICLSLLCVFVFVCMLMYAYMEIILYGSGLLWIRIFPSLQRHRSQHYLTLNL